MIVPVKIKRIDRSKFPKDYRRKNGLTRYAALCKAPRLYFIIGRGHCWADIHIKEIKRKGWNLVKVSVKEYHDKKSLRILDFIV